MLMKQNIGDPKWDKLISYMQESFWLDNSENIVDARLKEFDLKAWKDGETEYYAGVNFNPKVRQYMIAILKPCKGTVPFEWHVTMKGIEEITKPRMFARKRRGAIPDDGPCYLGQ